MAMYMYLCMKPLHPGCLPSAVSQCEPWGDIIVLMHRAPRPAHMVHPATAPSSVGC